VVAVHIPVQSDRRPGHQGQPGARQCQDPGRVMKGKKMPGHMGSTRRTVQNLTVVRVVPEKNLILIKGSVPGPNGGYLTVRPAKKKRRAAA